MLNPLRCNKISGIISNPRGKSMIKKVTAVAVLCLGLFFAGNLAADDEYVDVFIGTLEIRDGRPFLLRCDLGTNTYLLLNKKGSRDASIKKLAQIGVGEGRKIQAHVWGSPVWEPERDYLALKVHSIDNVRPGTCHLIAMLEEYDKQQRESQPPSEQ